MSGAAIMAGMVLAFYVGLAFPPLVSAWRRRRAARRRVEYVRVVTELSPRFDGGPRRHGGRAS